VPDFLNFGLLEFYAAFVFNHLQKREVGMIGQNIEPQGVIRKKGTAEEVKLRREHVGSLPFAEFTVKVVRHMDWGRSCGKR
jgi:hypothetical protein